MKKTEMHNCKYAQFAPDMTVGITEPMALPSGEIQNIRRICHVAAELPVLILHVYSTNIKATPGMAILMSGLCREKGHAEELYYR